MLASEHRLSCPAVYPSLAAGNLDLAVHRATKLAQKRLPLLGSCKPVKRKATRFGHGGPVPVASSCRVS